MNGSGGKTRSKIVRLIREYDLDDIGDELVDRWTRPADRDGLRQLAEYFNRELLRIALAGGDVEPLDGEVENTYRLLTDDDVSSGVRTQTQNRLERRGIDVDRLERDFVSKQAVHTYLTTYREVELPENEANPAERRDRKAETIESLKHRLISVAERALADLKNTGGLTLGDFDVLVNIRVHCRDCGAQYSARALLADGSCDCPARD